MRSPDPDPAFEALLEYLKRCRGFDFTGYKRASLTRRIQKRMLMVGIESCTDYVDYLEAHPEEFSQLFNTILINVTAFFRDAPAWEYLTTDVLPRLIATRSDGEPIRAWSAGCASGEETYTMAMALAEALGADQFRQRVKIYATDVDEEALTRARHASYSSKEVQSVPEELLDRYFETAGGRCVFNKELRRSVIFGRHDLIQDAPISRIDLLVCRNALMYFNAETQSRILARFHFALREYGYLFLGKAEMLLTHGNTFVPVDLKRRVFEKVPKTDLRDRLNLMAQAGSGQAMNHLVNHARVREAAFDEGPVAQIVIDPNGHIILANERARVMFGLEPRDLGRPLQDLELSYRPTELRSCLEQAYAERRLIRLNAVQWRTGPNDTKFVDVQVAPLQDAKGTLLGASVTFDDVTRYQRLQDELRQSNEELETAYEELQSTNEELETTNEELQSTIEELETTNEELQSTNEELETMNEELQSTNEELETINEELRRRSDELNQTNAYLGSILSSMRSAVVVMDRDMQVQIWNHCAEDLWGLRAEEVLDRHFLNLDIGLPVEQLRQPIRTCLTGESPSVELTLHATNRRGRAIDCHVICAPLASASREVRGVILMMEEAAAAKSPD